MRFIRGQIGKSNKLTMVVGFSNLPYGLELLEGNIHGHNAPPNGGALGRDGTFLHFA